ncbi:Kef-type K+ transport system membrane component KefB [Nocardia transvalensis]|uniref:Kef-type K+ transport system membrane component KefB n=1 Tax=Nocardia transvalensis TaxID=37333 RepID=A0A7W9PK04_9NOCA|nr:cation:proton antiporter [Nocardia transvalensis]MBB5917591.1 Kef-type K+ transport system membrane component KefB [Nocardia transvalensis]
MPSFLDLTLHFFLQMAVILAAYRLVWPLLKRLGQMQVVAIMAAGFLLGPSVLGAVWPSAQRWLFPATLVIGGQSIPHPSLTVLYVVGQLGLVLYMFLVGASFQTKILTEHFRVAGTTAAAGLGVPLALGAVAGYLLFTHGDYFTDKIHAWQAALFLAAAVGITAFPVLAWIIHDSGLHHTRVGTMTLACAAFDDAWSWILLAVVVASAKGNMNSAVFAFVGGVGFVLFMLVVGRRLLRLLNDWAERDSGRDSDGGLPLGPYVVVLLVVLVCAWFTDWSGIYSVFGAFLAGVVMPRGRLLDTVRERTEPVVAYLLLPAFFVYAGLNTKLSLLLHPAALIAGVAILAVSFVGKFGAVSLTSRWQGMSWREAGAMGALANARGLMELVLINIGLTQGLITPTLFTILAIMTIVTTFVASPLFRLFERSAWRNGMVFGAGGETAAPASSRADPRSGGAVTRLTVR